MMNPFSQRFITFIEHSVIDKKFNIINITSPYKQKIEVRGNVKSIMIVVIGSVSFYVAAYDQT